MAVQGLEHVIGEAVAEAGDFILGGGEASGEGDDRNSACGRAGFDLFADFEAVHIGQPKIEQDEVEANRFHEGQGLLTVRGGDNIPIVRGESQLAKLADGCNVVDHENC